MSDQVNTEVVLLVSSEKKWELHEVTGRGETRVAQLRNLECVDKYWDQKFNNIRPSLKQVFDLIASISKKMSHSELLIVNQQRSIV